MATPRKSPKVAKKAAKAGNKSTQAGLIFPVGRVGSLLRKGRYSRRVGAGAAFYTAAVLEYLTAELVELSAKVAKAKGIKRITPRAINLAIRQDEDLGNLLQNATITSAGVVGSLPAKKIAKKSAAPKTKTASKKVAAGKKSTVPTSRGGRGAQNHKWQYWGDRSRWEDYDAEASLLVENAHADWIVNPHIDVRAVNSGDWAYHVDFNTMQQTNINHTNHKVRKIRRVAAE